MTAVALPTQRAIEALLAELVARFHGVYGVRDLAAVMVALKRVEDPLPPSELPHVCRIAATIGASFCQAHPPFVDRNLRVAWLTMFVTLRLNGYYLDARESDATAIVLGVADGSVDEAGLIAFLEANSREAP